MLTRTVPLYLFSSFLFPVLSEHHFVDTVDTLTWIISILFRPDIIFAGNWVLNSQ